MMAILVFLCLLANFVIVTATANSTTVYLKQSDFDEGSYVISESGHYMLSEDISFKPLYAKEALESDQPEFALFPVEQQRIAGGKYSSRGFALGFFAAIVIQADNVVLDLNQHTLSQSAIHAGTQRFFSLVELSSSPFPPREGPANFSAESQFIPSNNVTIRNGRLDGSSHHGIHGNNNDLVILENLEISNFEVVGISLNQVTNLRIDSVDIKDSKRNVPVSGRLSQAIFALQALSVHLELDSSLGESQQLLSAQAALRNSVSAVLKEIDNGKLVSNQLFASLTSGLPDGSFAGGILINPKVFVGDMLQIDTYNSSSIYIKDVNIERISIAPIEQSTMMLVSSDNGDSNGYGGGHIQDNVGAVFDLDSCYSMETGEYVPNELADFQVAMAAYGHSCLSGIESNKKCLAKEGSEQLLMRNKITSKIIDWTRGKISGEELIELYSFQANRDYMFHTVKGAIGLKIAGTSDLTIENLKVDTLENHATKENRGKFVRNDPEYSGFQVKGISVSSSVKVVGNLKVDRLFANAYTDIACIDYMNNVKVSSVYIDEVNLPASEGSLFGELPEVEPLLPFQMIDSCEEADNDSKIWIIILVVCLVLILSQAIICMACWRQQQKFDKLRKKPSVNRQCSRMDSREGLGQEGTDEPKPGADSTRMSSIGSRPFMMFSSGGIPAEQRDTEDEITGGKAQAVNLA
eukprot:CAMPEP_0204838556 /NCGR_PEP_ID=MMETSP1346-20131115/31309_1 /ASSEMBLY_ACC=CAM_ASM_000771 /TAXON_ID=215587 /ORGANISM="Aplanochytrium stocchinoi, Strain GSBS06" /LENGTH=692 /DNA_ID=CAMNT_0051974701 /DNA_START=210 /DNA_END=2288 /DNA_ORIENTATION=-